MVPRADTLSNPWAMVVILQDALSRGASGPFHVVRTCFTPTLTDPHARQWCVLYGFRNPSFWQYLFSGRSTGVLEGVRVYIEDFCPSSAAGNVCGSARACSVGAGVPLAAPIFARVGDGGSVSVTPTFPSSASGASARGER